jgi:phage terminase small subunit
MRERHRRFVLEYLIDLNGSAAAMRAGYAESKAAARACELLKRGDVQALLRQELEARNARTRVTSDRVILEYARIAFADPSRIARWSGAGVELVPSERLSDDEKAAVRWISVGGRKGARAQRFLLHDKLEALAALARLTGLATRGAHARFALPGFAAEPSAAERQAAIEKVERMIEARAEELAEQKRAQARAGEPEED